MDALYSLCTASLQSSNKVPTCKPTVCHITEFIIGLRELDACGRKTTKPNSQISADLAVGRKSLYTYIKLICLRSHWQTVIHIAVLVRPSNRKALQKVARQTVGPIHLTLDKKNKKVNLKNIEKQYWDSMPTRSTNSKRRSQEGNGHQLLQAVKGKAVKYIGNVL